MPACGPTPTPVRLTPRGLSEPYAPGGGRNGAKNLGRAAVTTGCLPCELTAEGDRLPLRERIHVDGGWRVAHDFNAGLPGWLVVVARRHITSLHELTAEEATALGPLLRAGTQALVDVLGCTKTYVMLFAEKEGFAHLHLHLVPRMADIPEDRKGPGAMASMHDEAVPEADRDALAERLAAVWADGG